MSNDYHPGYGKYTELTRGTPFSSGLNDLAFRANSYGAFAKVFSWAMQKALDAGVQHNIQRTVASKHAEIHSKMPKAGGGVLVQVVVMDWAIEVEGAKATMLHQVNVIGGYRSFVEGLTPFAQSGTYPTPPPGWVFRPIYLWVPNPSTQSCFRGTEPPSKELLEKVTKPWPRIR